jgi:DNA invertase Pin-like site-specific DNA recombinase
LKGGLSMKAILYYVLLMDENKDNRRAKQLEKFLDLNEFEVIYTYYDVFTNKTEQHRSGLKLLIKDLQEEKIEADAFLCLSVKDMGTRKKLISVLSEITNFIPNIYFTDIENHDDDIA